MPNNEAEMSLTELQSDFAVNLLRETSLNNAASNILSPISIAFAVSLAYAGAEEETKSEYVKLFSNANSLDDAAIHSFLQKTAGLMKDKNNVTLDIANRIFIAKNYSIKQQYRETVQKYYEGAFEQIDFENSEAAANRINEFIATTTKGRIDKLVNAGDINSDLRLALTNAVYFKGLWNQTFDGDANREMDFHVSADEAKKLTFMSKNLDIGYGENDDWRVVELPYTDQSVSFVIYLPKTNVTLDTALNRFSGSSLLNLRKSLKKSEVSLSIPKFKIEARNVVSSALVKLGLQKGFSNAANFKGISDEPLSISAALHKAFIEVNEEGSEAAAATTFLVVATSFDPDAPKPIYFTADSPFLFAVFSDDIPLFLGTFRG